MQLDINHIIKTHQSKIYKTCLGFTGDSETAKDLLQEVCVNLWLGLEKFNGQSTIATWIYRITVNTCLMYQRKKKITTVDMATIQEPKTTDEFTADEPNQDLQLLQRFITELPEKERIIMILYLENLSYEEIAEVIGISINYIGVKINRIKKNLTKKFEVAKSRT